MKRVTGLVLVPTKKVVVVGDQEVEEGAEEEEEVGEEGEVEEVEVEAEAEEEEGDREEAGSIGTEQLLLRPLLLLGESFWPWCFAWYSLVSGRGEEGRKERNFRAGTLVTDRMRLLSSIREVSPRCRVHRG